MRRQFIEIGVLAFAIAVATVWIGWWTAPLVGAGWGFARAEGGVFPALTAAVAAAVAWVALLSWTALDGPVGRLSVTLGGVMGLPGWAPLAATLLFPAVLAGFAAVVAGTLVTLRR